MSEVKYDESQIDVLEGLEAVRKRPAMYIGTTNEEGLHHCVWEIVNNSIDEARMGECNSISIEILEDGSVKIYDNGRGIPCGIHPKKGISTLEVILLTLHAGGKFGEDGYSKSGGLHGVGTSVVNALSDYLQVTVHRDGYIYQQKYSKGKKLTDVEIIGQTNNRGTEVIFHPDKSIFKETIDFNYDTIKERIKEMAFLNPNVIFTLKDNRKYKENTDTFHYERGIQQYIEELSSDEDMIFKDVIYINKSDTENNVDMELCFNYNNKYGENLKSLVNSITTINHGTHVDGFYDGMTKTLSKFARDNDILKPKELDFKRDDLKEGIIGIITCGVNEPQFEGQTKGKLGDTYVRGSVSNIVKEFMETFFVEHTDESVKFAERVHMTQLMRSKIKKDKQAPKKDKLILPDKVADSCTYPRDKCEVYVVEGDSAGGSAKQGRNNRYQAILPTKGKILNVEKQIFMGSKVINSETLLLFNKAIGIEFGKKINKDKLRCGKIIIMSDADVDGEHIRLLWITYIHRYFRQLIEDGYLYLAQPPLYKVSEKKKGGKVEYAYSDSEMSNLVKELGGIDKTDVQRYKGLGEMNASQLWDTTMNPETRTLLRVTIESAQKAEQMIGLFMGREVPPRQEYIIDHSSESTLDI